MKKILSAFAALVILTSCNSSEQKAETAATTDGKAIIENIMTRTSIPWHFVAVTSKDKLKEMAINNPNARMLEQAPLTIVVCGDMQKALEGEARALWVQDCSAATENILLAAHGLGLGAVWTALYLRDERAKSAIEALNYRPPG